MQKRIQALLDRIVSEGRERGLQVAAYHDGKLVVNAWAGIADVNTGRPVDERTLFPVFSTTKGMAATVIHMLVERGKISYDQPIASIWPEFAVHGKGGVTVRHALNHSAGVPQMPRNIGYADLCDWEIMCAKIADIEPLSAPGVKMEYHAMTYGWIVGEIARRVDGRHFQQFLDEEICRPLGIDTMFCGLPDELAPRVAFLEEPGAQPETDNGQPQSIPWWIRPLHEWMNRPEGRRACAPASSGIMNAVAIARHYAALLPGGVDGVELLPPSRVKLATEPQHPSQPQDDDFAKRRALGYGLGRPGSNFGETPGAFGSAGHGGSLGFAEPELKLSFGLTKNLYSKRDAVGAIVQELRSALAAR